MANGRCQILVLGVGNPDRGDDGVGPETARLINGGLGEGVEVASHGGEASSLLERIAGRNAVIFIDACSSGGEPGQIKRFDAAVSPLPERAFSMSTHGLGLSTTLELARTLGELPPHAIVYAIEAVRFETGMPLSIPVAAAAAEAALLIRAEIATLTQDRGGA